MERRAGVVGTLQVGVFFTEAEIPTAEDLGAVEIEISRQNANLAEVKDRMAEEVKRRGGDGLVRFKYGQRAHPWWQNFFLKWDSESWYGTGRAVRLPQP